jgi:hypothetical protein
MGRPFAALRYAALEGELTAGGRAECARRDDAVFDFGAGVAEAIRMMTDDESGANANAAPDGVSANDARVVETPASKNRRGARDGSKTAAKLETRMRRRAERLALDQVRHQELMDNRELRQARALSRRWFVLGRALDAAMGASPEQAAALRAAVEAYVTRPDELALLGWDEAGATRP